MMMPQVEQYFDGASKFYDQQTTRPEDWYTPTHLREVLGRDKKNYLSALVVGVGTGRDIEILRDRAIHSIAMIDISSKMLKVAEERYSTVESHHGDFINYDFGQSRYDLIVCSGVLEFIESLEGFIERCASLLSPGGSVYVTYEPRIRNHKPQELATEIVGSHEDGSTRIEGVRVYRRDMSAFLCAVAACGFSIREYFEHLAYTMDGDIFYHFAVLDRH